MKKDEVGQEVLTDQKFEAPQLTPIGKAQDVVQGIPASGWDHRGLTAPEFEFQIDGEEA